MGEVVELHGQPVNLVDNQEFLVDLCRYSEGLLTEAAIRHKYRVFDDAVWTKLGDDDELIRAIEAEKIRRVRNGDSKREKAQALIVKAPGILDSIATDSAASPRHRVDAIKTLDNFATGGPQAGAPASDRFVITIVMNDEVLKFDKSIAIDANDRSPSDTDTGVIAAITRDKKDDGGGQDYL